MAYILIFILGAMLGSFLNVCIHRLPRNESVVFPPSHCAKCNKGILWYDNIPILSYLALGGKCRFCGARISFRYLIVELLTALIALTLFATFGFTVKFFIYSILAAGLIIATFVDFAIYEIPDQVSIGGLAAGLILASIFPSFLGRGLWWHGFLNSAIGAAVGGGSIYLMGFLGELVFKKEAMGGGDVKLMAMIGAFLGWKLVVLTFFIAPLFGSVVGIALKLKDGRDIIPYGPFLSLAALISIFWGEKILGLFIYRVYY